MMKTHIEKVQKAISELNQGKMVVLTDHTERENEGDLIFPAEMIQPQIMNFMIRQGTGIVCLSLLGDQLKKLGLTYMVPPQDNHSSHQTPFTVSIEAKRGITTGVSAYDRTQTVLTAINDDVCEQDVVKPGHVFPLHAKPGGVLERPGHTEGAIDLVRLAGFKPAAILCEIMNPDGTMAKGQDLENFARKYKLTILSIADLIAYRRTTENLIEEETSAHLPIQLHGNFKVTAIKEKINKNQHIVLSKESISLRKPLLVRIHSSCMTGDLFGSQRCDCHQQLHYSLQKIEEEGGMLIYLNQEGRGIGIFNKIKAYLLQEQGFDTVEANQHLGLSVDDRDYYIAANFLRNQNISHIRLLTNNPSKVRSLEKYGIESVIESIPIFYNEHNFQYLKTKREKLNHDICFTNSTCDYRE